LFQSLEKEQMSHSQTSHSNFDQSIFDLPYSYVPRTSGNVGIGTQNILAGGLPAAIQNILV